MLSLSITKIHFFSCIKKQTDPSIHMWTLTLTCQKKMALYTEVVGRNYLSLRKANPPLSVLRKAFLSTLSKWTRFLHLLSTMCVDISALSTIPCFHEAHYKADTNSYRQPSATSQHFRLKKKKHLSREMAQTGPQRGKNARQTHVGVGMTWGKDQNTTLPCFREKLPANQKDRLGTHIHRYIHNTPKWGRYFDMARQRERERELWTNVGGSTQIFRKWQKHEFVITSENNEREKSTYC